MDEKEYCVEVTKELIQDNLEKVIKGIGLAGKGAYKELLIKTGKAFSRYYDTSISKYSKTKTILYRNTPVDLYDFYVNLDLEYDRKNVIDSSKINTLIEISKSIIITGIAGCGKSTLLKHLFLNTTNTIKKSKYLPIYIELRNVNDFNDSFLDFIYTNLTDFNVNLEKKYFERILEHGKFIVFFDGFDEISRDKTDYVSKQIIKLSDKHKENIFIVSSRPDERFVGWNNFTELKVLPLTKEKTLKMIGKLDYDTEIKELFMSEVDLKLYDNHQSFLSNPLLTTIMLMTFSQFGDVPNKTHLFYSQAFDTLYCKHDVTKVGYKREMYTDLAIDDFKNILSALCIQTYLKNEINFTEDNLLEYLKSSKEITRIDFDENNYFKDLEKSLCIIISDGTKFTFTHRMFQEYFTALFIVNNTNQKQKEDILLEIQRKILLDYVFKLIFEIDRELLEDHYIIPILEDLKRSTKFGETDKKTSYFLFFDKYFGSFMLSNNGDTGLSVPSIGGLIMLEFNKFINMMYKDIYHKSTKIPLKGFTSEIIKQKVLYFYNKMAKPPKSLRSFGYDILNINPLEVHKDKELSDFILQRQASLTESYEYAMFALEKIKVSKKQREKSINDLLIKKD